MRKALFAIALGLVVVLGFVACGPGSDSAKSRKMIDAAVAAAPDGYIAGEVQGGNWLSTAGNQQNFLVWFKKPVTTESVVAECSSIIKWATSFGANQFRDGDADLNNPVVMLSGNEAKAQQKCVEVLSIGIDPGVESGSAAWQMFGAYQSDGTPLGEFYIDLNHSYDQESGKTELTHHMNMTFYTMLGVTP